MKVQIVRLVNRRRRYKADGKGSTLDKGYARGFVDGFLVTCSEGKGWDCSCLDDDCQHPDALAEGTGIALNTVKSNVRRMVDDDQLDTDGEGRYFPRATATPATDATQEPSGLHELHGLHLIEGASNR